MKAASRCMAPMNASVPPPTIPILSFRFVIEKNAFDVDQIKLTFFFKEKRPFLLLLKGKKEHFDLPGTLRKQNRI
jgi:hypothetical protein